MTNAYSGAVLAAAALVGACNPATDPCAEERQGTLEISIYGEEFIEERIPAAELVDGWEIVFDKFLVHLSSVAATRGDCAPDVEEDGSWVFDLAQPTEGSGYEVLSAQVPVGAYDDVDYAIGPATATSAGGNASEADRDIMSGAGYSLYVAGVATHASQGTRSFDWGFSHETRYRGCKSTAEVTEGAPGQVQLTIHGDHLLYDDLVSPEPNLAFDLIASADDAGDGDGEITAAELAATSVIGQSRYGVGNYTEVVNLWQFIEHLTSTVGHIDGEGHCHIE